MNDLKKTKTNTIIDDYFDNAYDLFGDNSLVLVELAGHYDGQIGAFFYDEKKNPIFAIADSVWSSHQIENNLMPSFLTRLINHNQKEYARTLSKLHQIHLSKKEVNIIPSHCGKLFKEKVKNCKWSTEGLNSV